MTRTHHASESRRLPKRLAIVVLALVGALALALLGLHRSATALPLYAARAGRTCDNCHSDPSYWKNPELKWRKCNLSCMGCHVNPGGGGLRTASGRYYARATLPIWLSSHRPWKDIKRGIPFITMNEKTKRKNYKPDLGFGKPLLGDARMAYKRSRYNGINSNPIFLFGLDTRYAFWKVGASAGADRPESLTGDSTFAAFPMQLDVHVMLRPVKYFTLMTTAGALAKYKGYKETFERRTPFMVKDVFAMVHQLPYMAYARVGRFIPIFGTYGDDHTSPVRRFNELDQGRLHSRVTGVEIGIAPNYPFAHVSFFRPSQRDVFSGDDTDNDSDPSFLGTGWGAAFSAGWRDLGWQVGISGMIKRRDLTEGGNYDGFALSWAFNPWFFADWLPLTYLGELTVGRHQRQISGSHQGFLAQMHELDFLVRNGVNLRIKYDFGDPDFDVTGDHYHRLGFGGDLYFLPGLAFRYEVRWQINPGEGTWPDPADPTNILSAGRSNTVDFFFFFRGWY
ncbi:MAG: hypothetical protein KC503_04930 [Myxococcales bacterium]|nr:hypothetical protein [Myxococcales bacterium]